MTDLALTRELCSFITQSPTAFHAIEQLSRRLEASGFVRLAERDRWELVPGSCCYVTRNRTTVAADAYFPNLDEDDAWELVCVEEGGVTDEGVPFDFATYQNRLVEG